MASLACGGPRVTTTTSHPSASLMPAAADIPSTSKGLTSLGTFSRTTRLVSSSNFSIETTGTCLMQTAIFMSRLP